MSKPDSIFAHPGGLKDNRRLMGGPPPPPPKELTPGLGAVDLDSIVGSWTDYHVGASDKVLSLETAGKMVAGIEVSPGSLWDAMEVTPQNGPPIVISPGVRYPAGRWAGPIRIRPSVGRPRFPILSTAAFGTWVVQANTYSPQIQVGAPLFIPPKVELVAYPSIELARAAPLADKRSPLAFQATVRGSDVPASTFLAALVATYGRASTTIQMYNANANDWTGVLWGYRGSASPTIVWPIAPAVTFQVLAGDVLTVEINGEWDYIGVAGAWDAGAAQDLVLNWNSRD